MDKSKYMNPFDETPAKQKKRKKNKKKNMAPKEMPRDGKGIMGTINQLKKRKAYLDNL